MTDPRKELLSQIRALRQEIDPAVLKRADLARQGKVPYDQAAAQETVRRFLATRQDGGKFRAQLIDALKKGAS
ncbi:MAG: hypothetical protein P4M00_00840 [Azospirillaceae bacterium]|nr:hypothetical protein [Azospirillaceae bacterium]